MSVTAVTLHEMLTEHVWPDRQSTVPAHVTARCSCGGWSATRPWQGRANTLTRAHRQHQADARAAENRQRRDDAEAWCRRTGHCADCGCPGTWCQCTRPCCCAALHPVGSGIGRDPAAVFTDQPPAPVEQDGLFEATP